VLAAGGIVTSAQMAAAIALGAEGVWCGSVWLTTMEAETDPAVQKKMLAASSSDTVRSREFEPQTSCMPWEMRKFNCRKMPARDGPCHSSRTGHAQNDGQLMVKTILKKAADNTNTGREEPEIWQSSRQPASRGKRMHGR
jgi:glutamate synthase domain-containing protein 2